MIFQSKTSMRGFTLVELLVTMAIFISVITIATGALYSAQAVNTRLEQTQAVLDGVNLATEIIVRDIRYGSNFYCATSIPLPMTALRKECSYPTGGTVLIFRPTIPLEGTTDHRLDRVAYYLSSGVLYKDEYPYGGTKRTMQVTSSDVNIQTLAFYANGVNSTTATNDYGGITDYNQPLVTMVISGVTIPRKVTTQAVNFSVQTSGSSRSLDN
jgi:prepilin-type N-terminal cleavage/methylation domain-containing protein